MTEEVIVKISLLPILPALLLTACAGQQPAESPKTVQVSIASASGSKLGGKATFSETKDGVAVTVDLTGAPPGKVAAHVHENGDCSSPDAKSAGEHFNPQHKSHGLPSAAERHLGDLGNVEIKPDGTGSSAITVPGANLKENDPSSYAKRAIIIHEKADDGGQPAGNAGARIGCAVIR